MAHANDKDRIYTVNSGNEIEPGNSQASQPQETSFRTEQELAGLAVAWPSAKLVEIWNRLPDVQPVRKFTDRATAVRRIWKALQSLPIGSGGTAVKSSAKSATASASGPTKTDSVITLLRRPAGATLAELMAATGWQSHSVRGFMSGHLSKKLRLKIKSFTRNGARVYRIRP